MPILAKACRMCNLKSPVAHWIEVAAAILRSNSPTPSAGGSSVPRRVLLFFVYVLRSDQTGRLYTGQTSDLSRRLQEHNSGVTVSTCHGVPRQLVHSESLGSRSEAVKTGAISQEWHGPRRTANSHEANDSLVLAAACRMYNFESAPVAQLDRAIASGAIGREFESLRARQQC
jgi:putative endonuclease